MHGRYAVPAGTTQGVSAAKQRAGAGDCRARTLEAAFAVLRERGYAATGTREIAARARLSKREIYAEFGSKEGIFGALIETRASLMRRPLEQAVVEDVESLAASLRRAGAVMLELLCDPAVITIHRLALSAAEKEPELARVHDERARKPYRRALAAVMARARSAGLLDGASPDELAGRFLALLIGELQVALLLGVVAAPSAAQLERRARSATEAFLTLHARAGR